jgi:hypothetical protein
MDSYLPAMRTLLNNEPCSFSSLIQKKAKELDITLTQEGTNLLDGLLCHFTFIIVGTTQSMPREVPSQKDYEYCLRVMGFGDFINGPIGNFLSLAEPQETKADLPTFFSEILDRIVNRVLEECASQECMVVEEMAVPPEISETDIFSSLYKLFKKTYLFENSEFRKTNSAYIGPWKLNNGGKGNCLFYSLRQLISIWKAQRKIDAGAPPGDFCFSLWPEEPKLMTLWSSCEELSPQNVMRSYKKCVEKMESESHRLRISSAKFFSEDLDSLIPGDENNISYMKDGQVLNRRMTKADFIYTAKEGDLKLEPEFQEERKQWANAWCIRAQQNGEWGCMRMITGFAHLVRSPRCIAMYFFRNNERERSRTLERTDEQTIKLEGCPPMIGKEHDSILKLPVKRMEDEIRISRNSETAEIPKKILGLIVKHASFEQWNLPRADPQRHCALYHEGGRHWCVLVSAIQMEELRRFTNIDFVAKPLF